MKLAIHANRLKIPACRLRSRQGSLLFILLLLILHLHACQSGNSPNEHQRSPENAAAYPAEAQVQLQHTRNFSVSYHQGYKMLQVFSGADSTRYLLLPRDMAVPANLSYDQLIRIPIRKLITQSTTHVGMVAFAEAEDIITGVDAADFVYHPALRKSIEAGTVQQVGGGESLQMEKLMTLQPDLLMVSGMPGVTPGRYQTLIETGIPVLVNTEWMEHTPLARAEWVKLIAALTDREALVNQKFAALESTYDSLAALASSIATKPTVIWSFPYQDTWYIPGGNSYPSALLQQAGASWPWPPDTATAGRPITFEAMYAYGQEADYWINPGHVLSRQEILQHDGRFASFKPFRKNSIYNNNRRMNASGGGNDYYESGVVQPHLILADLIKILHPERLPDHQLYYYRLIE